MFSVNDTNWQVLLCRVNILLIVTRDEHLYLDFLAVLVTNNKMIEFYFIFLIHNLFLSFHGTGTAVITETHACLWTDGRYFNQAEHQLDSNWTLMKEGNYYKHIKFFLSL